jgi:sulfotransferase family protein
MHETQGDWLPVRAALHPTGLYFSLREIAAAELQDAFMQETIARVGGREKVVQIDRGDIDKAAPDTAPAGLIFHVARCGSTLVSQMLKQHGDVVVYAEPLPFNEILLPPHKWPKTELVFALRSLGDAFARHAGTRYVLKFTSWNTFYCDLLAEAFPSSPWVLCIRDPVEVAVSLLNEPAGWLKDQERISNPFERLIDPEGSVQSAEERLARLYGAFCEAASRLDRERGRLLRYESLPAAAWDVVAPHFGLTMDEPRRRRMADAASRNSKAPLRAEAAFASDVAKKQAAASASLRSAIDALARPRLARLETLFAAFASPASPGDTRK